MEMSSSTLIIGRTEDATRMSKARTLEKWPHLELDPIDVVALAKLCVFVTGDRYDTVIKSFVNQTPKQPDVEPWDFENLLNPVMLIPERYVHALADMEDEDLPKLAKKWCAIEEFKFYKFDPKDIEGNLRDCRKFAARCLKAKRSLLFLLAP